MKSVWIYDLEQFKNFHSGTFLNIETMEIKSFIIHTSKNNITDYYEFLNNEVSGLIGFNNLSYDYPLLHFLLVNKHLTAFDPEYITDLLYNESNRLIGEEYTSVPYNKVIIPQLDLFKIWHFDNKARQTSLKSIEIAIDFDNVEDLPFESDHLVLNEEIDKIMSYNLNDVNATHEFYKITKGDTNLKLYKGVDKIQLRKDIQKEYGINCINYNDVKIGDSINKVEYLRRKNITYSDLKNIEPKIWTFTFGDCIPDYIEFETDELRAFLEEIKKVRVDIESKQEFQLVFRNNKYTIAKGGIHSKDPARTVKASENIILRDADVGSQYPNAIRKRKLYPAHLGIEWLKGYTNNIIKRMKAKVKKLKAINEALKSALNGGGFGKTNESYNWQYSPFSHFSCTIGNQFEILMLIEMLELEGINVISANTDGIVCHFDKELDDQYYETCNKWEQIVGNTDLGKLEYLDYKQLTQTSVNDYIAEPVLGNVKKKGDFCTEIELHKNPSMKIRAIALENYFIHGIKPEDTIMNHTNIYDFCKKLKVTRSWKAEYHHIINSEKKIDTLSKHIRYYISNNGGALLKKNKEDGRLISAESKKIVTIFNKYIKKEMKDYNINYNYYISEVYKIINNIDDGQLKLF